MGEYLGDAGPLAWPALLLGLLGLAAAAVHAVRRGERQAGIARAATAGSVILALINAMLGYQLTVSLRDGAGEINVTLALAAIGECLNGVVVTLAVALLVSLLFVIAAFRHRSPAGAS